MPRQIRILIVEDQPQWSTFLERRYEYEFQKALGLDARAVIIDKASTADEAAHKIHAARNNPYDFVSLDIHLGPASPGSVSQDGLHLLESLERRNAAWMVTILTGVETDPAGDHAEGRTAYIRRNLRSKAMQTFPPERLVVIEKPAELAGLALGKLPEALAHSKLLENRLQQAVSIFEHSTSLRNVFRKLELDSQYKEDGSWKSAKVIHWQIRYDCGEMITLPEKAGMEAFRALLEHEREEFEYGALLALAAGETALSMDGLAAQRKRAAVPAATAPWEQSAAQAEEAEITEDAADGGFGSEVKAAATEMILSGKAQAQATLSYDKTEAESRDAYLATVRKLEAEIDGLRDKKLLAEKKNQIKTLKDAIGKLQHGGDSKERQAVSAYKMRIIEYLREKGLIDFAKHLEDHLWLEKGKIHYSPSSQMDWQTS